MTAEKANGSIYDHFPGLKSFMDNMSKSHPEYRVHPRKNLYVLQSVDRDGNITDERYGMNLVTDTGMDVIRYGNTDTSVRYSFLLLEGVSSADAASVSDYAIPTYTRMIKQTSDNFRNYTTYPMTYDSETGVISQSEFWKSVEFDYNYPDIDSDMTINCIIFTEETNGTGGQNVPFLKVTTYDSNGLQSPIIKHINEKLVMNVITVSTMDEDILIDGYTNGQYLITNFARYNRVQPGGNNYTGYIQHMSGVWSSYATTGGGRRNYTYGTFDRVSNNDKRYLCKNGESYSIYKSCFNLLLIDPRVYASRTNLRLGTVSTSYGFSDHSVMNWYTEEKLSTAEEISSDMVYTDSIESNDIGKSFGMYEFSTLTNNGIVPVTDFHMTDVKGYNYTSHDWDIDISFVDAPDAYYDNPFVTYRHDIGVGTSWGNYISINPRAKDVVGRPSVGVASLSKQDESSLYPMYATDKYWDRSSWELISNIGNIPASLQKKKYFISVGGDNGNMNVTYDQQVHRLNVGSNYTVLNAPTNFMKMVSFGFKPLMHQGTLNWILGEEHLMFMDGNDVAYSYKLTGPEFYNTGMNAYAYDADRWAANYDKYYLLSGEDYVLNESSTYSASNVYYSNRIDPVTIRYEFDDKILVASHAGDSNNTYPEKVRLYTITSASSAPTYQDITIDTNTVDRSYPGIYTASHNGYFVIQDQNTKCANIISISDGTVTKLEDVEYCYALEYSNYCIYKVANSSPITFVVYDMSTNTIHDTFTLNDTYANIVYIFGWKDYFYIKSTNSSLSYYNMYNISDGSLSLLSDMSVANSFITERRPGPNGGNDPINYRLNQIGLQMFTEDILVISPPGQYNGGQRDEAVPHKYIKASNPEQIIELFKHGSVQDRQIDTYYEVNSYDSSYGARITSSLLKVDQSVSQSKLLLVDAMSGAYMQYVNNSTMATSNIYYACVCDLGPIVDSDTSGNMAYLRTKTADDTLYHGALVYWNFGIIRMTDSGMTWYPLERFINSKITGTTKTIQAINNPKKIGNKQFVHFNTNLGVSHAHTDPPRSTGDLQMVFKHDQNVYSGGNDNGTTFMRRLCGEVEGIYQVRQFVASGTIVRVEIEPETGFEFLAGTFKWYLKGFTITDTDTGTSATVNWTSSLVNADDKNQTNGDAITTASDANAIGVCITTTSTDIKILMPTMIKGIKITTDPHLST